MMTAYVRLRYILKSYPVTVNEMAQRFMGAGMRLPRGGCTLQLANEVHTLNIHFHMFMLH